MPVPTAVPPSGHLGDAGERGLHALDAEAHLAGVAAELLAEGDGRRVHEVGAARLDDARPRVGLASRARRRGGRARG